MAPPSISILVKMVLHAILPVCNIIYSRHMFAYYLLTIITRWIEGIQYCVFLRLKWFFWTTTLWFLLKIKKVMYLWFATPNLHQKNNVYMDCKSDISWHIWYWDNYISLEIYTPQTYCGIIPLKHRVGWKDILRILQISAVLALA